MNGSLQYLLYGILHADSDCRMCALGGFGTLACLRHGNHVDVVRVIVQGKCQRIFEYSIHVKVQFKRRIVSHAATIGCVKVYDHTNLPTTYSYIACESTASHNRQKKRQLLSTPPVWISYSTTSHIITPPVPVQHRFGTHDSAKRRCHETHDDVLEQD